jgi:metallo-beta-lactamase family protein
MKLQFLGAAQTVTGSKYLVSANGSRIMVDCGLYQGIKNLRLRNWEPLPFNVADLDAVVLSHAHIDHSGYLPAMYRQGYRGPIYCSRATLALCRVLLPDAGYLQEEDARYANRKKFSRHDPAEPLFTEQDAERVLRQFHPIDLDETVEVAKGIDVSLRPVGHILGACSVRVGDGRRHVLFSGDVGRFHDEIMRAPEPPPAADYIVVESTYGDRKHSEIDAGDALQQIINETVKRGGIVLVPAFAVGRAQFLLHILQRLRARKAIPAVPIYLNSPMAIRATEIFCSFHREHKLSKDDCELMDEATTYVRTVEESQALTQQSYPCIIISASGMASGGRVLHHLKALVGDHRNSVVFVGYQAPGTRGAVLVGGGDRVKIHGNWYPVRAEIHSLDALSAHADADELMQWLGASAQRPRRAFVTHGEPAAADALRLRIQDELGWRATVPEFGQEVLLD